MSSIPNPRTYLGRPRQELPWGVRERRQPQQSLPSSSSPLHQKEKTPLNPALLYTNRPTSTMSEFTPRVGVEHNEYYSSHPQPQRQQRPNSATHIGSLPSKLPQQQQQRQQQRMNMYPPLRPSSNPTPSRLRSPHLAFGKCSGVLSRSDVGNDEN